MTSWQECHQYALENGGMDDHEAPAGPTNPDDPPPHPDTARADAAERTLSELRKLASNVAESLIEMGAMKESPGWDSVVETGRSMQRFLGKGESK